MPQFGHYARLVLTAFLWGGTFVAGRILAREVPPFSAAFLRFALAFAALWAAARCRGRVPWPGRAQLLPSVLLGLTGIFAYNALFFFGLQTVPAGRASVIIALNPVAIAVGSAWLLREPLGRLGAAGVAVSVLGALVVVTHGNPGELFGGRAGIGELAILGCVASWTAYTLVGKVALRGARPLETVLYACAAGDLLLLGPAAAEGVFGAAAGYSPAAWGSLVYLALGGSALAFVWYYRGVEALGAARAGVFINLVPVSGVLLSAGLLGEPVDGSLVAGGALVLAGIAVTNRARRTV